MKDKTVKKELKSVKILGKSIKIKRANREKIQELTGVLAYGCYDPVKRTIYIETESQKEKLFQETILHHEIAHAIMSIAGLDQVIAPELQEIICESFANAYLEIIPQLTRNSSAPSRKRKLPELPE